MKNPKDKGHGKMVIIFDKTTGEYLRSTITAFAEDVVELSANERCEEFYHVDEYMSAGYDTITLNKIKDDMAELFKFHLANLMK